MSTRTLILPLAVVAVLALLALPAVAYAPQNFKGKVVNTADEKLVMTVGDEQYTFVTNEDTKITLDGKPAKLADIEVGHNATVTAEKEGDQWVASLIAATSS